VADNVSLDDLGAFAAAAEKTRRRYPTRESDPQPPATATLANLGDALGDPRAANPTLQQIMAMNQAAPGPMGPMPSDEQIQAYLKMTGQIYPQLPPVNPAAWDAFLAAGPHSLNIEDRRGINRRR
jgi:hypothetical protein